MSRLVICAYKYARIYAYLSVILVFPFPRVETHENGPLAPTAWGAWSISDWAIAFAGHAGLKSVLAVRQALYGLERPICHLHTLHGGELRRCCHLAGISGSDLTVCSGEVPPLVKGEFTRFQVVHKKERGRNNHAMAGSLFAT